MRKWQQLGFLAAELDRDIEEVFVETREFKLAEDLEDPRCIFLGRTGSGKSAIVGALARRYTGVKGYLVVKIHPDATYLDRLVQGIPDDGKLDEQTNAIVYKLAWHYVIMIRVLRARFPDGPNSTFLRGERLKAYRFLQKADELSQGEKTFGDVFLGLFQEIKVGILSGKLANPVSSLLKETDKFSKGEFWDVVGGEKLYLLFDDLDLAWNPDSEQQQALLRALLGVIQEYNHKERVKPVVAIRDDILLALAAVQREKIRDYLVEVKWSSNALRNLLARRVNHFFEVRSEFLEKDFFQGNVSHDGPVTYIVNRTANRPRDLIEFVNLAIQEADEEGDNYIFPRHIRRAEPRYAASRLVALNEEWKWVYPSLDEVFQRLCDCWGPLESTKSPKELSDILKVLIACCESGELPKWLISYYDEKDPTDFVGTLCRLGLIRRSDFAVLDWDVDFPPIRKDSRFDIHPMYAGAYAGRDLSVWS